MTKLGVEACVLVSVGDSDVFNHASLHTRMKRDDETDTFSVPGANFGE